MVADLVRLGISVRCWVSARSQYLVEFFSFCWITGGHTIYLPIDGLLPPTGIEPTPLKISVSKVAGLQVYATIPISTLIRETLQITFCLNIKYF